TSSLNVYLAGLSIFDFVLLIVCMLLFTSGQACKELHYRRNPICVFYWIAGRYLIGILNIARTGSVYICVAITVDRFLAVKYPLHFKLWCTPSRALKILFGITLGTIVYRIPVFFEYTNDECGFLVASNLSTDIYYFRIYTTFSYLIYVFLVPWIIMLVLNAYVVIIVHQAYKVRGSMKRTTENYTKNLRKVTLMSITMVTFFLLFNFPAAIKHLDEVFHRKFPKYIDPLANLLICFNSAFNFIVYAVFSARFRQLSMKILCNQRSNLNDLQ
ncbi:hypothetical protein WR25_00590, partial [Diploscapter pachys]